MCLYFSYNLPDKTELANDTFKDKKSLIFFQDQYKFLLWQKFCPTFVAATGTIAYQTETFGLTDYTLTYQVQVTNNAYN